MIGIAKRITATWTNVNSLKKGKRLHSSATLSYSAWLLGIPLPVRAYYAHSFPTKPFQQPRAEAGSDVPRVHTYARQHEPVTNSVAWRASGSVTFAGNKTVKLVGSAKAAKKGSGMIAGGTGEGHWVDANAFHRVSVK